EILTEVLLAGFAGAAIGELRADPLLATFVVGAVIPDHCLGRAGANAAADIEITPFGFVFGYLKLDDFGAGLIADDEVPLIGGMGLSSSHAQGSTNKGDLEKDLGGHGEPQWMEQRYPPLRREIGVTQVQDACSTTMTSASAADTH